MPADLDIQKDPSSNEVTTATSDTTPAELTTVVDELLNQLSTKFSNISAELISKMDEMSKRLDNLESTIQAGASRPSGEDSK